MLIFESRRVTFLPPHSGQGGAGFVELERYSSNWFPHASQRYS